MSYTLEDEVKDLDSKFSDTEIWQMIDDSSGEAITMSTVQKSIAHSLCAQSMIAYNNMIDARLRNFFTPEPTTQKEVERRR